VRPDAVSRLHVTLGRPPAVVVRAPGRVNLVGDHTDYQDGFCLPLAIDLELLVGAAPREDGAVTIASAEVSDASADTIVAALHERGHEPAGADLAISSTIPVGSGLSSSAACNVGAALALTTLTGTTIGRTELARTAQRAEHLAGTPCGIMDQMACVHGRAGHALLLDCRSLETEPVPIPDAVAVVVVHSGLPRVLATSAYAARRAACEQAATRLGIASLRDTTIEAVADDPIARHVVSENARVLRFAAALRAGAIDALGPLLDASHESLARDFAVSTPELDLLCVELRRAGALGARLTGAGFGGCVVALAPTARAETIAATATRRYRAATDRTPFAFIAHASDGASVIHRTEE
jgi:galactokinase